MVTSCGYRDIRVSKSDVMFESLGSQIDEMYSDNWALVVMLSTESEKAVPSSSQSPLMMGIFATLPCWTSCWGLEVRKMPSVRGSHAKIRDCP